MLPLERLLRRAGSVVFWAVVVVLGVFGIYFAFANYPWFGSGLVLLILLSAGSAERKRRTKHEAREAARQRDRASRRGSQP